MKLLQIVALVFTVIRATAFAQERPNVLLILTDQQRGDMLSCAGNRCLKTPNLDRLAAEGMRFARAYVSNPVCIPSRFSLMTGHLPSVIGMEGNDDERNAVSDEILLHSLGKVFQRAGYTTAYAGKVHLPGQEGVRGNVRAYGFEQLLAPRDFIGREPTVHACVEFLKQPHEQPFLLVCSLINPHDICYLAIRDYYEHGGEKRWGLERNAILELDKALALPPGVSEREFFEKHCPPLPPNHEAPQQELTASLLQRAADAPFVLWTRQHWDERKWRFHRWAYARLTESVDEQIGRVLDALREAGLEQKTIVAMTSDHGEQDGSHRLVHKTFLYEESVRVPLLLRWKGMIKPEQVNDTHLVCTGTDLLPTLCDLAGLPVSPTYPGRSLKPLTQGRTVTDWRQFLIIETRLARLVHMGRWKYMVGIDPEQMPEKYRPFLSAHYVREALVDLREDPGEMRNVGHARRAALEQGRRLLQQWCRTQQNPLCARYQTNLPPTKQQTSRKEK